MKTKIILLYLRQLKKAQLYRDLGNDLENSLSVLAEEGRDLSGGQKQRINLARGFL